MAHLCRNALFKKRSEYAARGIAHYWIVDPQYRTMTCLELVNGLYEEQIFKGDSATVTKPTNLEINFKELFGTGAINRDERALSVPIAVANGEFSLIIFSRSTTRSPKTCFFVSLRKS